MRRPGPARPGCVRGRETPTPPRKPASGAGPYPFPRSAGPPRARRRDERWVRTPTAGVQAQSDLDVDLLGVSGVWTGLRSGDQQHQDAQPGVRPDRGRRRVVVHVDVSTQVRLVDQLADEALELPAERAPSGKRRRDGRCGRPGRRGWIRRAGSARGNRAGGRCDSPQFVGEGLAHPGRILRRWSSHPPRARAWRR